MFSRNKLEHWASEV